MQSSAHSCPTRFIAAFFISITFIISIANARILNVPEEYQTIQAGINAAEALDTVLLDTGIYRENINFRSKRITVASNFIFDGNFRTRSATIINGGDGGPAILFVSQEDSNSCLVGLRITGSSGRRTLNEINRECYAGASIFCFNSSPSIKNCYIRDSRIVDQQEQWDKRGGGIWLDSSKAIIRKCIFDSNSANKGGGIFGIRSDIIIDSCDFYNNAADGGCAIEMYRSHVELFDCYFLPGGHPEVRLTSVSGIIHGCSFVHQFTALSLRSSNDLIIENCGFSGNDEYSLLTSFDCSVLIRNCFFSTHRGLTAGISGSHPIFEYCVFRVEEPSNQESAIYSANGDPEIINCTIQGGIWCYGSDISLLNTIVSGGNGWQVYFDAFNEPSSILVDYSLIHGGAEAIITNDNGQLDWRDNSLGDEPVFTEQNHGFALRVDSPCIDTGDPDSPPDPDGTRADMGAFYYDQRGDAPRFVEYFPEQLDLNIDRNDTLTFVVQAEDAEGDSIRYLWRFGEETISVDSTTVLNFNDTGAFVLQCLISDGHTADSISWNLTVIELAVPNDNQHNSSFALHSAYPNPFNSSTRIRFSTGSQAAPTRLAVYDISGRLVADLLDRQGRLSYGSGKMPPPTPPAIGRGDRASSSAIAGGDSRTVVWNAEGLPGGIYLIRLQAGDLTEVQKVVLMR